MWYKVHRKDMLERGVFTLEQLKSLPHIQSKTLAWSGDNSLLPLQFFEALIWFIEQNVISDSVAAKMMLNVFGTKRYERPSKDYVDAYIHLARMVTPPMVDQTLRICTATDILMAAAESHSGMTHVLHEKGMRFDKHCWDRAFMLCATGDNGLVRAMVNATSRHGNTDEATVASETFSSILAETETVFSNSAAKKNIYQLILRSIADNATLPDTLMRYLPMFIHMLSNMNDAQIGCWENNICPLILTSDGERSMEIVTTPGTNPEPHMARLEFLQKFINTETMAGKWLHDNVLQTEQYDAAVHGLLAATDFAKVGPYDFANMAQHARTMGLMRCVQFIGTLGAHAGAGAGVATQKPTFRFDAAPQPTAPPPVHARTVKKSQPKTPLPTAQPTPQPTAPTFAANPFAANPSATHASRSGSSRSSSGISRSSGDAEATRRARQPFAFGNTSATNAKATEHVKQPFTFTAPAPTDAIEPNTSARNPGRRTVRIKGGRKGANHMPTPSAQAPKAEPPGFSFDPTARPNRLDPSKRTRR